jgi:Protein of unknown function (DUF1631)
MAIAAKFQSLLERCQEMEFSHLRPLMDRMFENADVALLDFAEKAESNAAQAVFFEAMNEVRKKRKNIEQHFYTELKNSFSIFPARPDEKPTETEQDTGLGNLSLVETDEVETHVASQNAAGKLASRIMDRIFALKQRLAVLNGGNAIEENQIPGGPAWLTTTFRHAVEQLELENKVRLVFIALFEKYVLNHADAMFHEYNKRLIDADILPHLRYEVRKQDGSVEIIERNVSGEDFDEQADESTDSYDSANESSPSDLGDEIFGRICELMSVRGKAYQQTSTSRGNVSPIRGSHSENVNYGSRHSDNSNYGSGGPENANYGSPGITGATLANRISTLQNDLQLSTATLSSTEFIENIEIDEDLIQVLQGTLADERAKIFGSIDRREIPAADANVIELVGMMFEYMLQEEDLPNLVKALLSRLHTPMLKVAVIDKTFFTHTGHSARKLLNDMTRAGKRWVDENSIDRGIFPTMRSIVDRIMSDFKENVELFDDVLEEFTGAVGKLDQRARHVEKRTNEAANGQEKLQAARSRAQKEIHSLTQGKPVAEAVHDFLQRIWADKLTFLLLRDEQGDESPAWHKSIDLANRIVEFSAVPSNDEQRENRRQQLDGVQQEIRETTQALQKPDKEKLLNALFESQSLALQGEAELAVVVAPVEPEPEPEEADSAEASPEQLAMLDQLKAIPFGTWFEFRKPGKPSSRAKLSWRSTVTEKFMFVDQMGVKAAVISMHDLADCMINGRVRILQAEKKPFVDRALNAIHRMLDHAA